MENHRKQQEYDCTHDHAHPDHLVCIAKVSTAQTVPMKKGLASVFHKRYHAYYHPRHPQFLLHRSVDALLAISITALIGSVIYLQFTGPLVFSPIRISIAADTNKLISGEHATFSVIIKNTGNRIISDPVLTIFTPKYFQLIEPEVTVMSSSQAEYRMDKPLKKHEERTIVFKGVPLGEIGQNMRLSFSFHGTASEEESVQSDSAVFEYTISDASLDISSTLPEALIIGSEIDAIVKISNRSSLPIELLTVDIDAPQEIHISYEKPFSRHSELSVIRAHDEVLIPVRIRVLSKPKGESALDVAVMASRQGDLILQRRSALSLSFEQPALSLSLSSESKRVSLTPGVRSSFSLQWKNNASQALTDVQIGIRAKGFGIDATSLTSDMALHRNDLQLIWTKNQNSKLASVEPGAMGSVHFDVIPIRTHTTLSLTDDASIESTFQSFSTYSLQGKTIRSFGDSITVPLNTIPSLQVALRYYSPEGDQIGRGPLPLKSGFATSLYAFFDASSSIHAIENTLVTARLPSYCIPNQSAPIHNGDFTVDENTGIFSWTIGTLPSQFAQPDRQTGLAITIICTPTHKPLNSDIMMQSIRLSGTDSITHTPLTITIPDIPFSSLSDRMP